jgi:hypothetical protein
MFVEEGSRTLFLTFQFHIAVAPYKNTFKFGHIMFVEEGSRTLFLAFQFHVCGSILLYI